MEQPSAIDDRIAKLCAKLSLEIIGQVDRGKITLGFLEQSLAEFARQIRREVENSKREPPS
jgi:hypothetical protein